MKGLSDTDLDECILGQWRCTVEELQDAVTRLLTEKRAAMAPVPMLLACPSCGERHIDEGDFATKPHHTHACQECGMVWRPAIVPTVGVRFLPGFKNP